MHLSHLAYAIWIVTTGLDVSVCAVACWRGLWRRLPLFTAYLTLAVVTTGVRWVVYGVFGFGSWTAYDAAWISNGVMLAALGLAIGELCFRLLGAYRGVWALAWRILLGVSFLFLVHAGVESAFRRAWLGTFVMCLDRDLQLTATAVLVVLLLIGRYYTLEIDQVERAITAGLCILSATAATSNALMMEGLATHPRSSVGYLAWIDHAQFWWNLFQDLVAVGVLAMWFVTLRQPFPAVRRAPTLVPVSAYRELSAALNLKLRALDARLLELLGP
jgi:hypothetical protein